VRKLELKYQLLRKGRITLCLVKIRGKENPMFGKKHYPETLAKIPSQQIEVLDLDTNKTTSHPSINFAAIALDISQASISQYLNKNQKKPYKKRYVFKKID
jgi:hypothetical protein